MRKRILGIFLVGAAVAYVLDLRRGLVRKFLQVRNGAANDDMSARTQESATTPGVMQPLRRAANTVRDSVAGVASAVTARAGRGISDNANARTDVAPRPVTDPIPEGDPNDPTLVARVESELFQDGTLPKGEVVIDAANGVITLRGTVSGAQADEFVARTRAIEGVARVVDLLQRN